MRRITVLKRIIALSAAAVLTVMSVTGCTLPSAGTEGRTENPTQKTDLPTKQADENANEIWAENMNARKTEMIQTIMQDVSFDEKFLSYIAGRAEGNYMASPLSFRYALGLLIAGAAGETKTELLRALGVQTEEEWIDYCLDFNGFVEYFAEDLERERRVFEDEKRNGYIPKDSEEPFRALRVANSVWKNSLKQIEFTDAYRDSVSKNYAAEYRDFTPQDAVQKINAWADVKTEHMIEKLLPENYPTDSLAVVLMNALYFKDSWVESFNAGATKTGDFHARNGQKTEKEFMTQENTFSYYEDAVTKLVILQMYGGVSMAFVIGSTENLSKKISEASSKMVRVTIPKMDLETSFSNGELVDFLRECGVNLALTPGLADFSAMIGGSKDVYVDDIIQKTRIKLDEEGVEAAAVTAIMVRETAYWPPEEPKVFTADQPFSFYVYTTCNDTTAILFAGEVVE